MPLVKWLPSDHADRADLAVQIVSWNVRDLLTENLRSLFQSQGEITAEVIVIDNGSEDGTVEAVSSEFPSVRVIVNPDNKGFAAANEQGMRVMKARHCLLLNPDMRLAPDALSKTVEYLDAHADVGVVGASLSSSNGTVVKSVRRFPDIWSQIAILLKLPRLFPRITDRYLQTDFDYDREQTVDSVRGSFFAINRTALDRLGGLDERYFVWFEEVDYCRQVIRSGMKVMYTPSIHATDLVGRSFVQRRVYWKQKEFTRSMIQYFEKWQPRWQAVILKIARPFVLAGAWVVDRVGVGLAPARPAGRHTHSTDVSARATTRVAPTPSTVAIQILTYKSSARMKTLFDSLRVQTFKNFEVLVCDNSEDAIGADQIRQALPSSGLKHRFTVAPRNLGYTGGHNFLFTQSDSTFILTVNDDAVLAPTYLERVITRCDADPLCAAVTGLVLRAAEVDPVIDTAGLEYRSLADVRDRFAGQRLSSVSPLKAQTIFGVSGAVALYRRDAIRSVSIRGELFDPRFFMYKEDVELTLRLRERGYTAWFEPRALAYHPRGIKDDRRGFISRIQDERRRPINLRRASYRNQWFIYKRHWRSAGIRDLLRSFFHECARGTFVFLVSPRVFFSAWYDIIRGV